jgi:hypothetical protein
VSIINRLAGSRQLAKFADKNFFQKSGLKRDGPVFFSCDPVKVAGDERTITAIVAPRRGETSHPASISSGRAKLPLCPNLKTSLSAEVAIEKSP